MLLSHFLSSTLRLGIYYLSLFLPPSIGGSGGDPARRGEGSDVQSVFAVGVRGQSSDATGGPLRPPERGPRRLGSGPGCHHAAPAFHEVPPLIYCHLTNTHISHVLCMVTRVIAFHL